jgi:hypothetical protein
MAKIQTVTYVKLHQSLFTVLTGHLGDTLPSVNKTAELKMSLAKEGLLIECLFKAIRSKIIVPYANIVCMVLGPEEDVK